MERETVQQVDGQSIVTESGVKICIGNHQFEAGESVWIDGQYAFGNDRRSSEPTPNVQGVPIPRESSFIVLCDRDGNCSIFDMSFDKETEPLRPNHLDIRVNICEENSYDIVSFCYNKKGTKFAFISHTWDNNGNYVNITLVSAEGVQKKAITLESGMNGYSVDCYFDTNDDLIVTLVSQNVYFGDSYKEDGTHEEQRDTPFKYLYYKNLELDHTDDRTSQVATSLNRLREELLSVTDTSLLPLTRTEGARGGGKTSVGSGDYNEWTQAEVSAATSAWITANSYPAINSEYIYTLENYSGSTDYEDVKYDFDTKPVANYKWRNETANGKTTTIEYYVSTLNAPGDYGSISFFTFRNIYIGTSLNGSLTPVITANRDTGEYELLNESGDYHYKPIVSMNNDKTWKNDYYPYFDFGYHWKNKWPLLDITYNGNAVTGDALDEKLDYSLSYSNYTALLTKTCHYKNEYTVRNIWRYYGLTSTDTYTNQWWWRERITVDPEKMVDKKSDISFDMTFSDTGDGYTVTGTSTSSYGSFNSLVISKEGWSFDLTSKGPLGNPDRPIMTTSLGENYVLVTYYSFMGIINKKNNTIKYVTDNANTSYNRTVPLIENSSYGDILAILSKVVS